MHSPLAFLHRAGRLAVAFAAAAWLGGCALMLPQTTELRDHWPQTLPRAAMLEHVPFIPQRDYECGPAALDMVIADAGAKADLDQLIKDVYLPERKGSLQIEMLAAPRRFGLVSYQLAPRYEDMLREVAAGTPVIVLQNYGAWPIDSWHYAVVIGYDGKEGNVVLHSGEKAHLTMPIPVFEYLWKKSDYWAMVAVPPDRVPATADEAKYVDAIVAMERVAKGDGAARAYAAAVKRWPDDLMARVGLANAYYARGDLAAAERELRAAERAHPDSPVVLNNLAQTLSDLGRQREALALTDRALQSAGAFDAQLRETRALILKRMQGKRQQSAR